MITYRWNFARARSSVCFYVGEVSILMPLSIYFVCAHCLRNAFTTSGHFLNLVNTHAQAKLFEGAESFADEV